MILIYFWYNMCLMATFFVWILMIKLWQAMQNGWTWATIFRYQSRARHLAERPQASASGDWHRIFTSIRGKKVAGYTAAKRVQGREIMESAWIITFPTFGNKNHYLVFLVWKGTNPVPEFQRAHDLGLRRLSHKSIHWGRELPRDGDFGVYPTLGCTPYQIISSIPIFSISPPKKMPGRSFLL